MEVLLWFCLENLCSFSLPLFWLLLGVTKAAVSLLFFTEEFAFFFSQSRVFWSQQFPNVPFYFPLKTKCPFSVLAIYFLLCWWWWWNSCALPKSVRKEEPDTPGARTSLLWCYTISQDPLIWRQAQTATCVSPAVSKAPQSEPTGHELSEPDITSMAKQTRLLPTAIIRGTAVGNSASTPPFVSLPDSLAKRTPFCNARSWHLRWVRERVCFRVVTAEKMNEPREKPVGLHFYFSQAIARELHVLVAQ